MQLVSIRPLVVILAFFVQTSIRAENPPEAAKPRPLPPALLKPEIGGYVTSAQLTPDGKYLTTIESDVITFDKKSKKGINRFTVYDTTTYERVRRFECGQELPMGLRHHIYGKDPTTAYITVSQTDPLLRQMIAFDIESGKITKTLDPDLGFLQRPQSSPDGKYIAMYFYENHIKKPRLGQSFFGLWSLDRFELIRELRPNDADNATSAVFASDNKTAAMSITKDQNEGIVEVDYLTGIESRRIIIPRREPHISVAASPSLYIHDNRYLVISGGECIYDDDKKGCKVMGFLRIWDRKTGDIRKVGSAIDSYMGAQAISQDGKHLYTSHGEWREDISNHILGVITCWDTKTWKEVWKTTVKYGQPHQVFLTPSGKDMWFTNYSGLWQIEAQTGKLRAGLIETKE